MLSPFVKSVIAYRFSRPQDFGQMAAALLEHCQEFSYQPCAYGQSTKLGYQPVLGEVLVHAVEGTIVLSLMQESRKVPSTNLNRELNRLVALEEENHGRIMNRAEKKQMKEALAEQMLERAFPKYSSFFILIDPKLNMLFVCGASTVLAESGLALVRKTVGSLPVIPLTTMKPPSKVMTDWVKDVAPAPFDLGCKVGFEGMDSDKARAQYEDLGNEIVQTHIREGELITQLHLYYGGHVEFMLKEDLSLGGLKWADDLKDKNIEEFDELAKFDADCILVINHIRHIIEQLLVQFGGLAPLAHEKEVKDAEAV